MNLIFEINYAIFSIFAALLITEVMGSLILLFYYDLAKSKVLEYIVPIWEVTGTFGAFWVVSSDMAYPNLLLPIASIFGALLTVFLITLIWRNATIVLGEFITKHKWLDEKKLFKGYSISTLLLGISALIFMSSIISGAGVLSNEEALSMPFNLVSWASEAGSWLFLVGAIFILAGIAPVFFDIRELAKRSFAFTLLGLLISIAAYYTYSSSLLNIYIAIPSILIIISNLLYFYKRTAKMVTNKAIFISLLSIIIFSLQTLVYPYFLGKTLLVDSFTISGPMVSAFYITSLGGAILLSAMLSVYIWIVMPHKSVEKKGVIVK